MTMAKFMGLLAMNMERVQWGNYNGSSSHTNNSTQPRAMFFFKALYKSEPACIGGQYPLVWIKETV